MIGQVLWVDRLEIKVTDLKEIDGIKRRKNKNYQIYKKKKKIDEIFLVINDFGEKKNELVKKLNLHAKKEKWFHLFWVFLAFGVQSKVNAAELQTTKVRKREKTD